ncbi:MAG: DUF177 domain-containing protein [Candidatus Marinimicrobia bacterium]|nr:DUF177 domain-containing protein [Candidatus Neomarinimicrobiota bacterium]
MEILLSQISEEEKLFEFDEQSASIGLPSEFGHVVACIYIYSLGQKYVVHGRVDVDVHLTCDICLDEFDKHFQEKFDVIVDRVPMPKDPNEDEVIYLSPKALSINFNDYIRDQLFLALPIQKRCRSDCKGLCPVCGANLNREQCGHKTKRLDPRWETLKALKIKIQTLES